MDERSIAAFHEAGHVVIRCSYGLVTPSFIINDDGTGITAPSGELVTDLNAKLDIAMGGTVAEDLISSRVQVPEPQDIEDAVDLLAADELDGDYYGDLEQAIDSFQRRCPNKNVNELVEAMQTSYQRCLETLRINWPIVELLANKAIQTVDGVVHQDVIDEIWNSRQSHIQSTDKTLDIS